MQPKHTTIIFIGAGNVGYHLGLILHEKGFQIRQVFSRKKENAKLLAAKVDAESVDTISHISPNADLYILAVKDDAIGPVSLALTKYIPLHAIVVHTSGGTSIDNIDPFFINRGSFYPLQTFSKHQKELPDWSVIPVSVDSRDPKSLQFLTNVAKIISKSVYYLNDQQRLMAHCAAVFVNNFSNHLYKLSSELLTKKGLPVSLMQPLFLQTAKKLQYFTPDEAQTGPAIRKDKKTIDRHLALLQDAPEMEKLYRWFTESIQKK